ncbi:MAG: hypothetical protein MUF84_13205 [Anaerolineae bacterium]|nr:hypothetical protein [Anaerolineae bacterium]
MDDIVDRLLVCDDPCIGLKTRLRVTGEDATSPPARALAEEVRTSDRVRGLLSIVDGDGRIPGGAYAKFTGAHWVLPTLADIGYPQGDARLIPLRDQVYETWLDPQHTRERVVAREASSRKRLPGVPIIEGRARRCASQEGNALWSTLALGIADARAEELAGNLRRWQWPDGGWNCDRSADASNSSFMETLIPMRALALHGRVTGDTASAEAALRASEVFLKRRLFRRQSDGSVIREDFTKLHYPCYWHYDILFSLKVLGEMGLLGDPRCGDALDLLESKRLPDGGFPAERRHYKVVTSPQPGGSLVNWGGVSAKRMNPWVTIDALCVLRESGRSTA